MAVPPIPRIENIHQAVLAAVKGGEKLNMKFWHKWSFDTFPAKYSCKTTHCRAGWVVHLAGDAGYRLEAVHGTPKAALLIYAASGSPISARRFYDDHTTAMADIIRCAEEEAAGK